VILALLPVLLSACGGTAAREGASTAQAPAAQRQPTTSSVYPDDPQVVARAATQAQRQDLKDLWSDTLAMRRAAAATRGHTLKGTPSVRKATSRFIEDLDGSHIDDLSKNRAIDHAAAAVSVVCDQCFQQLEAIRPIPAIAH